MECRAEPLPPRCRFGERDDGRVHYRWVAPRFRRPVTVLEREVSGKILAAAIHHRPLGSALRFAAEIRDRLAGVIPADTFLTE